MSVFLMVNCTRLLPLTVYNPPGTYGAGDKSEVIITVVPGFRSIVDSVTTFRSSCGVVFSPGAIPAKEFGEMLLVGIRFADAVPAEKLGIMLLIGTRLTENLVLSFS